MINKNKIKQGFIWSALDSIGTQAIALSISLILANMLGPNAFGLVALLTIFIAVANVFVDSGFNSALIRKLDRNEDDYSTTFYFSLFISIVCYTILYISAPYISNFYSQPELTPLTRVLALTIIINSFAVIQRVKLTVELNFKIQAKCNLFALIISGVSAFLIANAGYGAWSLVCQQLILVSINVLLLNIFIIWKPKKGFSKKSFNKLFGFGYKLLLSSLIDTIYKNIYGLIIGKYYNAHQLGLFNQADRLSTLPAMTLTGVIQKVTYPMLSSIQDDREKLDESYLNILKVSTLIIFPLMLGICITAKPLVNLILGSDWAQSAEYISIITLATALYPIHAINLNMLKVKGRSDLFLRLEIIKKILLTVMLIITVPLGVKAMCFGMVITSYLSLFINTYYTGKLSSLTPIKQLSAISPIIIISGYSAFSGYLFGMNVSNDLLQIIIMLSIALISYVISIFVLKKDIVLLIRTSIK